MRRNHALLAAVVLMVGGLFPLLSSSEVRPDDGRRFGRTEAAGPGKGSGLGKGAGLGKGSDTLILYDTTGPYAFLGEMYAIQTANLVSHFGSWTARPVARYTSGEASRYSAVVYIGSTYDEPLPAAFLKDVLKAKTPVVWISDNIWQLAEKHDAFEQAYGFAPGEKDTGEVGEVRYKGTSLTRAKENKAGIMSCGIADRAKVRTLAEAVRADGTTFPWALRSGQLTYIGEVPFTYVGHDDRYLAFADLLFDVLAPSTATRHRALVRIEDVGPNSDPADLRAVADYLSQRQVPFTVGVFSEYRDPRGENSDGVPEVKRLRDAPEVVNALKYMRSKGGTLIMHGYTHQYSDVPNPYGAASGDDFEFFRAHVDGKDYVRLDGPVLEDSAKWAGDRIDAAYDEFSAAGLDQPTMFEFPHYAGSRTDYAVVAAKVGPRYDRGMYFPGLLSGGTVDHSRQIGQLFPYPVRDVYGSAVVPENLGNVAVEEYNHHTSRRPADILGSARRNLVVRDGVASFFFHPFLDIRHLRQIVEGIQSMGYTFVPASAVLRS